MDEYIGIVKPFGGNFAPQGWMLCNGALLPISQNTALFSILGTTYGGDGVTTFALPDLRGRIAIGTGTGPGLPAVNLGDVNGTEEVTLLQSQLPLHNHLELVNNANTTQSAATPGTSIGTPGTDPGGVFTGTLGFNTATPNTPLNPVSLSMSGGNNPHNNMQPYVGVNYIICVEGIFPSRS